MASRPMGKGHVPIQTCPYEMGYDPLLAAQEATTNHHTIEVRNLKVLL